MSTSFEFKFPPFGEHQERLFPLRREEAKWAHFWEMGTGKSWMVCNEVAWAFLNGEIDTFVVMAKKGEYANWALFLIPDLMPANIDIEIVLFNSSLYSQNKLNDQLNSLCKPNYPGQRRRLRVLVCNVEALPYRLPEVFERLYETAKGVFRATDESTCIKTYDAARSKVSYFWAAKSRMRRIMTGTPVTQSPLDLWGQTMDLGKGLLINTSFFSFRNTYCEFENIYLGKRVVKKISHYKNLDKLNGILSSFSDQVYKEDVLDLPPKVYKKHAVEMKPEQAKLYEQMRTEAMLEIEGHEVEVTTVLAQVVKLHQIACGQLKVGEDEYVSIDNNRIEALLELLEDFNGKAIIWATYRQTLVDVVKAIRQKFGPRSTVDFYGGTSAPDRERAVRDFQDPNSPVRFFVANPQSAGYGTTLTEATLVIYYSNGYNLEHRLQSEDRAHRIGQTKSVTYVDFVTPGTVDERIVEVLRNKKNLAQEVLGSPISEWI